MDLNRIIDQVLSEKLIQSSQQSKLSNAVPQIIPPSIDMKEVVGDSSSDPALTGGFAKGTEKLLADQSLPLQDPRLTAMKNLNVLNIGAPKSVRAFISLGQMSDPDLQKKNINTQLMSHYKEKGLISDDYDFGLRIGPASKQFEFKDPNFGGQYNIIDPIGLEGGDFADLAGDIPTLVSEAFAGYYGSRKGSFVKGLTYSAAAAYITEMLRLKGMQLAGKLPENLNLDDFHSTALDTAQWSALGGAGGQIAYKVMRPLLSTVGLLPPKLRMDMDEDTFIKAWNSYKDSPEAMLAKELDVQPTSAQVAQIGAMKAPASEKAKFEDVASLLALEEKKVMTSPSVKTGAEVRIPTIEAKAKATDILKTKAGEGVETSRIPNIDEKSYLEVGQFVKEASKNNYEQAVNVLNKNVDDQIVDLETQLSNIVDLPDNVVTPGKVGEVLKETLAQSYVKIKKGFDRSYENIYKTWEDATGITRDTILKEGQVIKPAELLNEVETIKKTFANRAFVDKEEKELINNIYNTFTVLNPNTNRRKLVPVSLKTITENLRDLKRLERQAYKKRLSGADAPYADTLSNLVEKLEKTRSRVLSRKGVPEGLSDSLKALDDSFASFATKFRSTQTSAIAKIRKRTTTPEDAFNILFKKDSKGQSQVSELTDELKKAENLELNEYVSDSIRNKWLNTVVTRDRRTNAITSINLKAHENFINEYGTLFNNFLSNAERRALSTGTVKEFGEELVKTQVNKAQKLNELKTLLKLEGGELLKPETLFKEVWQQKEISKFSRALPLIKQNDEIFDSFKALIYKDMFDPQNKMTLKQGNLIVPNLDNFIPYIQNNKAKLQDVFGSEYVTNLEKVVDAIRPALTDVVPRSVKEDNNIVTTALRSFVGVFTRPGRILTAINKARGRLREDALVQGLINPEKLALMAKATKFSPEHSQAVTTLGRIFFGDDRAYATEDEMLNVDRPETAKALILELERNRRNSNR